MRNATSNKHKVIDEFWSMVNKFEKKHKVYFSRINVTFETPSRKPQKALGRTKK